MGVVLGLSLGAAVTLGAVSPAQASTSSTGTPATDPVVEPTPVDPSTLACVEAPTWTYTWSTLTSSGTVTAAGGVDGQAVCSPLYLRAVSWTYDTPLAGIWPQTFAGKNDYTLAKIGAHTFASPGTVCGQDDAYATFSPYGFRDLAIDNVLTAPNKPREPQFLHQAITTGTGGSTWSNDAPQSCTATVAIDKKAVAAGTDTPVTEVAADSTFDYTITASNTGTIPAAGVTVTDSMPASLAVVDAPVGDGWTCSVTAPLMTCTMAGTLAPGTSAPPIRVPVKMVAAATSVENTGMVCASNGAVCATSTAVVAVAAVPDPELPTLPFAALSIDKTASVTSIAPGGSYSYTLAVSNPEEGAATNVTITDTLDNRLRITSAPSGDGVTCEVSPSGNSGLGSTITCAIDQALLNGQPKTITVGVTVDSAADAAVNSTIDNSGEACAVNVDDCATDSVSVTLVKPQVSPESVTPEQLPTLPLPESPSINPQAAGAQLQLGDAALAHTGVDAAPIGVMSLGALALGLGLMVVSLSRRRARSER